MVEDCDILNDEILVSMAKLTDKRKYIKELYLDIQGEEMRVWRNTAGGNIPFENLLSNRLQHC